jgi:hypothetical protein
MALQTLRNHNQETWILSVALVKAYDTLNRYLLWKILGVPDVGKGEWLGVMFTNVPEVQLRSVFMGHVERYWLE